MNIKKVILSALAALLVFPIVAGAQIVDWGYPYGSALIKKSYVDYSSGLLREAEAELRAAVEAFPNSPAADKAVILQSRIDLFNGNYNLAIKKLTEFIEKRNNSPLVAHAALERAYAAFERKKYAPADIFFDNAETIALDEFSARNDSVYYRLAHNAAYWSSVAHTIDGDYDEARKGYEHLIRAYPNGHYADDALFALGLASELDGANEAAVNYYKTVDRNYPYSNSITPSKIREINNYLILRNPSSALMNIDKTERIIRSIQKQDSIGLLYEKQSYFETAPEEILYLKGEAYNLNGSYSQALNVFQEFIDTFRLSGLINMSRLGAGWAALNLGDYTLANKYFDEAIYAIEEENDRVKSLARLYKAVSTKKSGDVAEALRDLSEMSVQPGFPYLGQALLELGQIYYESGDFSNASRALERALRESGSETLSARAQLLLGASYMEQKRWNTAVESYRAAKRAAHKFSHILLPQKSWILAEARLKEGIALVNDGSYTSAAGPLQEFIANHPDDERIDEALFWLAESYYSSNLLSAASESYEQIISNYPESRRREESLYGLGWANFKMKRFKKSNEAFEKMIAEYPESEHSIEVLSRQADSYYVTRDFKKAAEIYKEVQKKSARTDEGLYAAYQRSDALYRAGQYNEAVTALLEFSREYPGSSFSDNALYLVGLIRFIQRDYAQAIEDFKYFLLVYPSSQLAPRAHYAIGDSYYNKSQYQEAIAAYKNVIENSPGHPLAQEALQSMQYAYRALGMDDEADSVTFKYVEVFPETPFALDSRFSKAMDFYVEGRNKDAIEEYEKFIRKYPDNEKAAEALYWMGKSYMNLKEYGKAEGVFKKVENNYPESEQAALSMLETGLMYKKMNRIHSADSTFLEVINKYPEGKNAAQAGFERGILEFTKGDTLSAVSIFKDVADKYHDMGFGDKARYQLAMYYRAIGEYDSARYEFAALATKSEENPVIASEAQYRLGEMNMRLKNWAEAIKAFKIVNEIYYGFPEWRQLAMLNMGMAYEELENYEEAKNVYSALVTMSPGNEYGKTAERRLERLKRME